LFLFGLCFQFWDDFASIMDVFRCVEMSRSRKKNEQVSEFCWALRCCEADSPAVAKFDRLYPSITGP
jgi:hypothetical protein